MLTTSTCQADFDGKMKKLKDRGYHPPKPVQLKDYIADKDNSKPPGNACLILGGRNYRDLVASSKQVKMNLPLDSGGRHPGWVLEEKLTKYAPSYNPRTCCRFLRRLFSSDSSSNVGYLDGKYYCKEC